jgi:hypothetical protein
MKTLLVVLMILFLSVSAGAFNCGPNNQKLATKGMSKYQILKDCGGPVSSQVVGYDIRGSRLRIVEEWVYITESYGVRQMYLLKINGKGVVADIEWLGDVK